MATSKLDDLTPGQFNLNSALYERCNFEGEQAWKVATILYFNTKMDCYCPGCKKDATFEGKQIMPLGFSKGRSSVNLKPPVIELGLHIVKLKCTRAGHELSFFFKVGRDIPLWKKGEEPQEMKKWIEKIGQTPSFADLNLEDIKKYRPVITQRIASEFRRGVSLASYDVGIGSFVYLRRVFESLITEAHDMEVLEESWTQEKEDEFRKCRMDEKIKMLSHQLPSYLVKISGVYSILSKGIHELTEQECLQYFDVLKAGIEFILEEKLERHEREKRQKAVEDGIQKALSDLGGKG